MRKTRSSSHLDEDAFNQAVAAEVRALLARHNKIQADVSRHLGITANAASFRWKGKTPWSTAELLLLCDWLDVDAAAVIATAKASALKQTATKGALESMLSEQERAEITDARRQMRPTARGDEQETGREAR